MKKLYFFLLFVSYASLSFAQPAGWNHINVISVTENSGTGIGDYQLKITFNSQALVNAGEMNANGSDIRFGTTCTTADLNYWIESGINTTTTTVWVKVDTLLASQTRDIFMFYGNSLATSTSDLTTVFTGAQSGTDSVQNTTLSGSTDAQRGFRFSTTEDVLVTSFGKFEPTGATKYVTLFDFSTQAILRQEQISGPAAQYSYGNLSIPIWLTQGTEYLIEIFNQAGADAYYFGAAPQMGQHMIYYDMRYCNGCTQNTFPTNTLGGMHYGYVDFLYYTKKNISPAPTYSITGDPSIDLGPDTTYCNQVILDAGYAGGSYAWNTTETTQAINVISSGIYGVTVITPQNCIVSDSVTLVINPAPALDLGVDSSYCESTILNAGPGYSYLWSDNSTQQTLTVISTGMYSVEITDSNNCSNSDTVSVTINPLPVVSFNFTTDSVCTSYGLVALAGGNPSGGTYSGTGVSAGNFDPSTGAGNYTLTYTYTDGNGCSDNATDNLLVSNCLGLENSPFGKVLVFPNPGNGLINVVMENFSDNITCAVYDPLGKSVYTRVYNQNSFTVNLDLTPGIYVLELSNGAKLMRAQIIIQ